MNERERDKSNQDHPIYGIPILVKDNTNVEGMPTTGNTFVKK
jgi:amidase